MQLTNDERASLKSQYQAAGIKLIVSAFSDSNAPTTTGADPTSTAQTMAAWVMQFNLDGIDVDYEVRSLCFNPYIINFTGRYLVA